MRCSRNCGAALRYNGGKGIGGRGPLRFPADDATAQARITNAWHQTLQFLHSCGAPMRPARLVFDCPIILKDRAGGNKRAYYHIGHKGTWTICASTEAGRLSDSHLYGLILHEFGHPIAQKLWGQSGQQDADEASMKFSRIPILYKSGWVVQWISPGDVNLIRSFS